MCKEVNVKTEWCKCEKPYEYGVISPYGGKVYIGFHCLLCDKTVEGRNYQGEIVRPLIKDKVVHIKDMDKDMIHVIRKVWNLRENETPICIYENYTPMFSLATIYELIRYEKDMIEDISNKYVVLEDGIYEYVETEDKDKVNWVRLILTNK
ncbi:hypothetical protein ACQUY5_27090 [Bacillus cereus]|uniref:hypothetical protein n=1 Tax=Bacillus cereus TaxID=1396 RepID=UPI003D163C21